MKNTLYAIIFYWIFTSCAQRVAPLGGKKDIISPKLTNTIPKNQSLNYNENTIELSFDEYVKVENINQQLIITPTIEGNYTFKPKQNGVKLVFNKPFKQNTTYSLNFRSTFKDITESNEAKNIKLVFSTGSKIDSLKISGKITDPLTNKPILDALVGLYIATDTLNIKKEKPYYFTKTDSLGKYTIENIKPNNYKIYAIVDANNNTLFNETTEKIGYNLDVLNLNKNLENQNLEVVKQDKLPLKIVKTKTSIGYANIELNKGIRNFKIIFKDTTQSLPYILSSDRELKIFNTKNIQDTIKYEIIATDSVENNYNLGQKFIFKKPSKKTEAIKEELKMVLAPKFNTAIENQTKFIFTFNKPILKYDYKKIILLNDTIQVIEVSDTCYKWNETKNILTLSVKSKSKKTLRTQLLKEAFVSIENDTLKVLTQDNPIIQTDDMGSISGEIKGAIGNEIVQLLNERNEVQKEIFYQKKYIFKNITPGKYYLRIIQDLNKNQVWDSGNLEKKQYHEKIQHYILYIQVKANFELTGYDFTIDQK